MRKFYRLVAVNRHQGGYVILLDDKPVKTRLGQALVCPTEKLAHAMMAEWAAQGDNIVPDTMPLTQIMITLLDQVIPQREDLHERVMNYFDTDLLCYRTQTPPLYAAAQKASWDPIVAWFEENFGAALKTTTEIAALRQSAPAHQAVETYIRNLPDTDFTVLQIVTAETGSLLLALAFIEGSLAPDEVFRAAFVEELLKSEIHHEDVYGKAPDIEKKQGQLQLTLDACKTFLSLAS